MAECRVPVTMDGEKVRAFSLPIKLLHLLVYYTYFF